MHLLSGKMIGSQQFNGFPYLGAAEVTFTAGSKVNGTTTTSKTFSAQACGAAHPARLIVVAVAVLVNGGGSISVTCDGVSMTEAIKTTVTGIGPPADATATGIFYIAQGDLPDPTVTDVDIIVSNPSSATDWACYTYRLLSYTPTPFGTQSVTSTASSSTISQTPAISSVPAGHVAISIFAHRGTGSDAMADAEHTWAGDFVEGDQDAFAGGGDNTSVVAASKADASSNASWTTQHTYTTTLDTGQCAVTAVWEA